MFVWFFSLSNAVWVSPDQGQLAVQMSGMSLSFAFCSYQNMRRAIQKVVVLFCFFFLYYQFFDHYFFSP